MPSSPAPHLPGPLPSHAHKGDAGRVLCIAGSSDMPGAAILSARAAQRAGAGLVTVAHLWSGTLAVVAGACPEALHLDVSAKRDLLAGRIPSALRNQRQDVRLVGPGLTQSGSTRELVHRLLEEEDGGTPLLLDADALAVLAGNLGLVAQAKSEVVLTPHPGEARALLGEEIGNSDAERMQVARRMAELASATVVLKGQHTVVVRGEREFVCRRGNPGMATAGSGDVLSGVVAALLCRCSDGSDQVEGYSIFDAVCAGVELHSLAGDLQCEKLGQASLIASDLIDGLPAAFRSMGGESG